MKSYIQISGLAKASEILDGCSIKAMQLAEDSAQFIRRNLYDETSGELKRSYRQGPGTIGQADDYAFLIQGNLSTYSMGILVSDCVDWQVCWICTRRVGRRRM